MVAATLSQLTTMVASLGIEPTNATLEMLLAEDEWNDYKYILPFIIGFGVIGNIISLVAILHSRLRRTSANQYLLVLTTADSVFLLALLMIWTKIDYQSYWFCVGIEYVLQVASYISSWCISALAIERYLAIVHPLKHMRYGHMNRYKLMAFWVPVPFLLNLVQFFVLRRPDNDSKPGTRQCILVDDSHLAAVVDTVDVVLCYLLPCLIVAVLNLALAARVQSAEKGFMMQKASSNSLVTGDQVLESRRQGRASSGSSGSTRILFVVPIVYVLLNTPFYLFRLADTISTYFYQNQSFTVVELKNDFLIYTYNTAHYLYYINFACDVIVYAFSSATFRKTVVIAWRRLLCPHWHNEDKLEQNSHAAYSRSCRYSTAKTIAAGEYRMTPRKHNLASVTQSLSPSGSIKGGEAV